MYKKIKKDKTTQPYEVGVFTKRDIVQMISDDLQINKEIVDSIINRMIDIVIELVSNHNMVRLTSFITFEPKIVIQDKTFKRIDGLSAVNGSHVELRVRPSKIMKELHKLQQQVFHDTPYVVTRDSWRGARKWWLEQVENTKNETTRSTMEKDNYKNFNETLTHDNSDNDNPFLSDEE